MLQLEYRVRFLGNELFQTAIESAAVDSITVTQLTFDLFRVRVVDLLPVHDCVAGLPPLQAAQD